MTNFCKIIYILISLCLGQCSASQQTFKLQQARYFDVQGHRGSRGENSESLLPAFAWAFIDGVTTLELDNAITKDGVVVVWHDEVIKAEKCRDTDPVLESDDQFPYVGKHIANLTLAQIKTLDCGSNRLPSFPLQLTHPGTKISTLSEVFKFAQCADPNREIQWNIESKINPESTNSTRGVMDFVRTQHKEFLQSSYSLSQITYQSFDWRTLIEMKKTEPAIATSALIDDTTMFGRDNSTSKWLGGLRIEDFPGNSTGEKIAYAARYIGVTILSPAALSSTNVEAFTTKEMIDKAHKIGVLVKPWTVNNLEVAERLLEWGVDGIITDYPMQMRRLVQRKVQVGPKYPKRRVLECLEEHVELM